MKNYKQDLAANCDCTKKEKATNIGDLYISKP